MPEIQLSDEELMMSLQTLMKKGEINKIPAKNYAKEIFRRHYCYTVNFCIFYGLEKCDAEDTAQKAFIKMYTCLSSFKKGRRFKSWFYTLVFNKIKDKYKELKKPICHLSKISKLIPSSY